MPAMPESLHTAPDGAFAVWGASLSIYSGVWLGWGAQCVGSRFTWGQGDGGTGRLTRRARIVEETLAARRGRPESTL
jgi:hypothetical protein